MFEVVDVALRLDLGESPVWDVASQTLICVDISSSEVHRINSRGQTSSVDVSSGVSAVVLTTRGGLVGATPVGLVGIGVDGHTHSLVQMNNPGDPRWRLNDAKCDAEGRLWSGSYLSTFEQGTSTLIRFGRGRSAIEMLTGLELANGIDWSPDGTTMYLADSRGRSILAIPFDAGSGQLGEPRTLVAFDNSVGFPDGLTVDAEGRLWTAMYQGGAIRSFTPSGKPDTVLELPISKVTSLCFGGADLQDLFVTTARFGLEPGELADQPLAGSVLVVPGLSTGREPGRFEITTIDATDEKAGS